MAYVAAPALEMAQVGTPWHYFTASSCRPLAVRSLGIGCSWQAETAEWLTSPLRLWEWRSWHSMALFHRVSVPPRSRFPAWGSGWPPRPFGGLRFRPEGDSDKTAQGNALGNENAQSVEP